ncbi:hypothetical protein PIB30_020728 [Stylosanthes scabra]|uniref:Uncharacterized protein n=1 Tax=Stylosanthes scabra TaxID=79078 RepID=A0ABU6Y6W4_9FABA|nr:hypothetical protein [Stylosanthes scabra]
MAAQMASARFGPLSRQQLVDVRRIYTPHHPTSRLSIQTRHRQPLSVVNYKRQHSETPTNTIRAELFKPSALVVASRGIVGFLIWTEIHHFLRCLGYPAGPQGYIATIVPVVDFHVLCRLVGSPLATVPTSYVVKELAKGSDDREHPYSITTGLLLASILGIFAHTSLLGVSSN